MSFDIIQSCNFNLCVVTGSQCVKGVQIQITMEYPNYRGVSQVKVSVSVNECDPMLLW